MILYTFIDTHLETRSRLNCLTIHPQRAYVLNVYVINIYQYNTVNIPFAIASQQRRDCRWMCVENNMKRLRISHSSHASVKFRWDERKNRTNRHIRLIIRSDTIPLGFIPLFSLAPHNANKNRYLQTISQSTSIWRNMHQRPIGLAVWRFLQNAI